MLKGQREVGDKHAGVNSLGKGAKRTNPSVEGKENVMRKNTLL
jgi:hypothetical protein